MRLYIVDAFTEEAFGGNTAGVVFLDEKEDFPKDEVCIRIANELRYSETAFIRKEDEEIFRTRYFTPTSEVDLCGHATIGAFYTLLEEGIIEDNKTYTNRTLVGDLEIKTSGKFILMEMGKPQHIGTIDGKLELEELYKVMGIEYEDILIGTGCSSYIRLFPMVISTGLPDILLPVKDKKTLDSINPDFEKLKELCKALNVVGVHAFCLSTSSEERGFCRNFAPLYGIDEESATGTANGALTYYLLAHRIIRHNDESIFVQGEKMGRPSKILTYLSKVDNQTKIQVGGSGYLLVKGELDI